MSRKYLIPQEGTFYKANMHCHSTFSDGAFTPAELKKIYQSRGYSIVAYTDHCIYKHHAELSDENFLAVAGLEAETSEPDSTEGGFDRVKTYHFNLIDTDPDYRKEEKEHLIQPNDWYYGIDEINEYIEKVRELGFLTVYNHPYWSLHTYDDYKDLKNLWAMEIFNYGCEQEGSYGCAPQCYDELLRIYNGKKLFCVAGDDNHNGVPLDSPDSDSFGAFTMIKAKSLTYRAVMDAFKNGDFYTSMGPHIEELYTENGAVYIKTSPVKKISLITAGRRVYQKIAAEGKCIEEAVFKLRGKEGYIRVDCTDEKGLHAASNAYRIEEIRICNVSSLQKVFADSSLLKKQINRGTALKGERFSYQAALSFAGEETGTIEASLHIESELLPYCKVYRVGSVPARLAAYKDRRDADYLSFKEGLFPDILYPLKIENGSAGSFILSTEYCETLWIEINVPPATAAGTYDIHLYAECKDRALKTQRTFSLCIADEVLEKDDFKYTQWLHLDCLADYYGDEIFSENHWKRIEQFIKTASENGVSVLLTPVFTPPLDTDISGSRKIVQLADVEKTQDGYRFSFERFHRYVSSAKKYGIKYLEIGHLYTQWGAQYPCDVQACVDGKKTLIFGKKLPRQFSETYEDFLAVFLPRLIEEIEKAGFKDRAFFHVSDEPHTHDAQAYSRAKEAVKKHIGNYPVLDALSDYDFIQKGIAEIPAAAIDKIEPFIRANVKPLWAYYCCGQARDVSNRFFAMPSWRNRIIGFLLYKFGIDGFLHWGYNFYYTQYSKRLVDPFMQTDAGGAFPAGDTFSVYPGKDGPIESIRLKVFYEALQDRRFLKQMEKKLGKDRIVKVAEEYFGGVIDFKHYPRGEKFLVNMRDCLL